MNLLIAPDVKCQHHLMLALRKPIHQLNEKPQYSQRLLFDLYPAIDYYQ